MNENRTYMPLSEKEKTLAFYLLGLDFDLPIAILEIYTFAAIASSTLPVIIASTSALAVGLTFLSPRLIQRSELLFIVYFHLYPPYRVMWLKWGALLGAVGLLWGQTAKLIYVLVMCSFGIRFLLIALDNWRSRRIAHQRDGRDPSHETLRYVMEKVMGIKSYTAEILSWPLNVPDSPRFGTGFDFLEMLVASEQCSDNAVDFAIVEQIKAALTRVIGKSELEIWKEKYKHTRTTVQNSDYYNADSHDGQNIPDYAASYADCFYEMMLSMMRMPSMT